MVEFLQALAERALALFLSGVSVVGVCAHPAVDLESPVPLEAAVPIEAGVVGSPECTPGG